MTPEQEKAYEEHLAELDRELEAALEDWKKFPILPRGSDSHHTTDTLT